MKNITIFLIFLLCSYSCDNKQNTDIVKIKKLIYSDNVNEIVEGYFIIGEEKQTFFIKDIFNNPSDNRISHHLKFKGISVYQSKMIAMKKISGLNPPVNISYKSNKLVIDFYYNWALEHKYIGSVSNE